MASSAPQTATITLVNATLILPSSPVPIPNSTLTLSPATGLITDIHIHTPSSPSEPPPPPSPAASASTTTTTIDLQGLLLAPGYLDLQVNGLGGVHFTRLKGTDTDISSSETSLRDITSTTTTTTSADDDDDAKLLASCARQQARAGVTGWWATIPTVERARWRGLLGALRPRSFNDNTSHSTTHPDDPDPDAGAAAGTGCSRVEGGGADLLGAHCEGPFLEPSKRGAHCAAFMLQPADFVTGSSSSSNVEAVYGEANLRDVVRMVTLAPELPGAVELIGELRARYPSVRIAMGHSAAGFKEGMAGVQAGACMVTHTFNAMAGVTGREPGLPGLMAGVSGGAGGGEEGGGKRVWYSVIGDGVHLHRATLAMALRLGLDDDGNGGGRCIGITDAIELAGMEDGVHKGNGQIVGRQVKVGNRVTIEGSDTLVGSCVLVDHVVRELAGVNALGPLGGVSQEWRGLGGEEKGGRLVKSVKAVSQNVADMMGEEARGRLEVGRRADLVVLDWDGMVRQTWVKGRKVFDRRSEE